MPFTVQPEHYGWWITSGGLFQGVLEHPDKEELFSQPMNKALNNPRNEGPEVLKVQN